jgi:hypothetical protein
MPSVTPEVLLRLCRGGAGWAARARSNRWAPFGLVELQRSGDSVQDGVGGTGQVPAFHAHVVIDAHPGEQRDLLASQPLDPAVAFPVGRQARLRGRDALAPRDEELANLGSVIHAATVGTLSAVREVLALPGTADTPKTAGQPLHWKP